MFKQTHYLISNAWEAEEMILKIMTKQDAVRLARWQASVKVAQSTTPAQYQYYFSKAIKLDNELVIYNRSIDELIAYLPVPEWKN